MRHPDPLMLSALPGTAFAFALVLARIAGAVMLLPGLGESAPPRMLRAGLALALAVLVLPPLAPLLPPLPATSARAAGMVLAEAVTGIWLGWLARVPALALPMAGQILAFMTGHASVLEPDAAIGAQSNVFGRMFGLVAAVVVLASGLWVVPIEAVTGSFRVIAPGAVLPAGPGAALATGAVMRGFALAFRCAAPFVVMSMVWQLGIGVISRLIPRLQVYFLAMPAQILGGLVLIALLGGVILTAWSNAMLTELDHLPGLR